MAASQQLMTISSAPAILAARPRELITLLRSKWQKDGLPRRYSRELTIPAIIIHLECNFFSEASIVPGHLSSSNFLLMSIESKEKAIMDRCIYLKWRALSAHSL
jgi:hypothetical protein